MHSIEAEKELRESTARRTVELFQAQLALSRRQTDRMFAWLMAGQWLAGILAALYISPRAWEGIYARTHVHVWAAIFLGGAISSFPIFLAWKRPGATLTRHVIAIGQILTSALLVHLSGGRIETHFHIFGSLAFLAFYRDWKVLASATIVVALDHAIRGIYWPLSAFGVLTASPWRWVEHAGWVLFEDTFLLLSIRQSLRSVADAAEQQARLEAVNLVIEKKVAARTTELSLEIAERKKAEQQLSLEYAISLSIAESSSMEQSGREVLQVIAESLHQDIGLLWLVDNREAILRCAEIYSPEGPPLSAFGAASRAVTFLKGVGIPGRVWERGSPVSIVDLTQDQGFTRAEAAAQAGLNSAFAFPVVGRNGISGVLEFFSREKVETHMGLIRTWGVIGGQLGRFFEHKRMQEQLFQSQKMETVGKMAGGIAHEFNSIMTAIIGQSELLKSELPPEGEMYDSAHEIGIAADRAAGLTRQLLAYGRKQMLQPEILDLNKILGSMSEGLRHLLGSQTDLRIVPGDGLKLVKADAGQIQQVILNIAMNAADAMPNGGKFTLETANVFLDLDCPDRDPDLVPGPYVMLAVTDTGTGMSAEVRQRVFDPFFTTKDIGRGTGLGLSTCHGIIKQSRGHITVYSEVDRGSTFKIYLPQIELTPAPAVPVVGSPQMPGGSETILMVEDDPALREMAAKVLKRLGYKVLSAGNGLEALRVTHQKDVGHIDLLFTDVAMPHMSGKELSDRVRTLFPETKILFMSAYAENAILHQGVLDPGVILLSKPFSPSTLARKVREVLDDRTHVHNLVAN